MRRSYLLQSLLLGLILAAVVPLGTDAQAQPRVKTSKRPGHDLALLGKQYKELQSKFLNALQTLAESCDDKGLAAPARHIRELAQPVSPADIRLRSLPRESQPQLPADLPEDERFWRIPLQRLQQEYAKDLYLLSRRVVNAGHVSLAIELVREAAIQDPDHTNARRILGYVNVKSDKPGLFEWVSPFEASMIKSKKVWHPEFGWILKDHIDRYERGERYFEGRWISAAKEAVIRQDFKKGWEIQTEHYRIRTNHSLEKGVELAQKLEDFQRIFFQTFAGYFNSPEQMKLLFEPGGGARGAALPKPNEVHYYRTRAEYVQVVKKEAPTQPVEITKGMYFPNSGIAHFFHDPDAEDDSTVYHEGTHQLLSGSRPRTREIGMHSNFWIIEAIACYMESYHHDGNRFTVGDPAFGRTQVARQHYMIDHYYVPLRDMARMGMVAFQSEKNISKNYSQGAAMVHFFMHYEDGKYRDALIEHLSQVYSSNTKVREAPDTLAALTGVEFEALDKQYGLYIEDLVPVEKGPVAAAKDE